MSVKTPSGAFYSIKKLPATNGTAFKEFPKKKGVLSSTKKNTGFPFQKFPVTNGTAFSRNSEKEGHFPFDQKFRWEVLESSLGEWHRVLAELRRGPKGREAEI